jgi:hypothetical protein
LDPIPAEDLRALNASIVGTIEVTALASAARLTGPRTLEHINEITI